MDGEKSFLAFPDVTVANISVNKSLIAEMSNKYTQTYGTCAKSEMGT